jgi:putative ABC transport system ATP-binding protein
MNDNGNILLASGLHKSFGRGAGKVHVLRGLDLQVRRGEFLAVMGSSGCGKSTLLHVLGLMTAADEGSVAIDGREVTTLCESSRNEIRRRNIGFVFQRFNLIGVLSGYDNILLSLKVRGLADGRDVRGVLEAMGVWHVARRKPAQMSMGEQQRVAAARALAARPELLLADEPTGSLDSANAQALLELLVEQNRRQGQTIVMITHSESVAQAATRVVHMKDGRILDTHA